MIVNPHRVSEAMLQIAEITPDQFATALDLRQKLPEHIFASDRPVTEHDELVSIAKTLPSLYENRVYEGPIDVTERWARPALLLSLGALGTLRSMTMDDHDFTTARIAQLLIPDVLYTSVKYPNNRKIDYEKGADSIVGGFRLEEDQQQFIMKHMPAARVLVESIKKVPNTERGMFLLDVRDLLERVGLCFDAPTSLTEVCENDGKVVVGSFDRLHRSL